MKKITNTQGITLIALVITIIVLLILAGVTINIFISENGLIAKVFKAKREHEIAKYIEEICLDITDKEMDSILSNQKVTIDMVYERMQEYNNKEHNGEMYITELADEVTITRIFTTTGLDVEYEPYQKVYILTKEKYLFVLDTTEQGKFRISEVEIGSEDEEMKKLYLKITAKKILEEKLAEAYQKFKMNSSFNLDEYLKEQGFTVLGDTVIVDGFEFEIDRNTFSINKDTTIKNMTEDNVMMNIIENIDGTVNLELGLKNVAGLGENYKIEYSIDKINWLPYIEEKIVLSKESPLYVRAKTSNGEISNIVEINKIKEVIPNVVISSRNQEIVENIEEDDFIIGESFYLNIQMQNEKTGIKKLKVVMNGISLWEKDYENIKEKIEQEIEYKDIDKIIFENIKDKNFLDDLRMEIQVITGSNKTKEQDITAKYYYIKTGEDLKKLSDIVNGTSVQYGRRTFQNKIITQANDIDLSTISHPADTWGNITYNTEINWLPIGNATYHFYGIYNGNNKSISNIYINNATTAYKGLFGIIDSGEANNININGKIVSTVDYTGGIAGMLLNSNVSNCKNKSIITGACNVRRNYRNF